MDRRELLFYHMALALYEMGRTIPHAFVTMYFINLGINTTQISIAQMFFMIAITFFEIPSGILSDLFSKKKIYYISCCLISVTYLIYMKIDTMFYLCIAQFVYGLSMALQSGTIDSLIFNKLYEFDKRKIENVTKSINFNTSCSMLIGSSLGAYLYYNILDSQVFLIAILFFLLSLFFSMLIKEDIEECTKHHESCNILVYTQIIEGIQQIKYNTLIFYLIILISLLQLLLQPFYNYWQPLSVENGFSENALIVIYTAIQIMGILSSIIYSFYNNRYSDKTFIKITLTILGILFCCSLYFTDLYYVIVILLTIIPRTLLSIKLKYYLQINVNNQLRSTITSFTSATERVFSFLTLLCMAAMTYHKFSLPIIIFSCFIIYVLFTCLIINKINLNSSNMK